MAATAHTRLGERLEPILQVLEGGRQARSGDVDIDALIARWNADTEQARRVRNALAHLGERALRPETVLPLIREAVDAFEEARLESGQLLAELSTVGPVARAHGEEFHAEVTAAVAFLRATVERLEQAIEDPLVESVATVLDDEVLARSPAPRRASAPAVARVSDEARQAYDERAARVSAESARFRAALPDLLRGSHAGRWVVFLGGEVKSAHDSLEEAYDAAVSTFGRDAACVLARVEPDEPAHLGAAAALFGRP